MNAKLNKNGLKSQYNSILKILPYCCHTYKHKACEYNTKRKVNNIFFLLSNLSFTKIIQFISPFQLTISAFLIHFFESPGVCIHIMSPFRSVGFVILALVNLYNFCMHCLHTHAHKHNENIRETLKFVYDIFVQKAKSR